MSVTHATFALEREYDASPDRVFRAWSDSSTKSRWFVGPDEWLNSDHELDFRIGGQERVSGGPVDGPVHTYEAVYRDIVPNERIVLAYDMYMDGTRISVSLATVEFRSVGQATWLVYTEQGVYLDDFDSVRSREQGTRHLLDALGKFITAQAS